MEVLDLDNERRMPVHVAIIMDGNGRWAKKRGLPRTAGHAQGARVVEQILEDADHMGIRYLTVYAFSTENWKRSQQEVADLFRLMRRFFVDEIHRCIEMGVRVVCIGNYDRLSAEDREVIRQAEEVTKDCDRLYLQIALSYGGRDEIVRAAEAYARDVLAGKAKADSLTEEAFGSYLYTAGVPDMDLVIRTGGDQRLSNFFPWQSTYADLWFTDTLWPDFSEALLKEALDYYRTVKINKGK